MWGRKDDGGAAPTSTPTPTETAVPRPAPRPPTSSGSIPAVAPAKPAVDRKGGQALIGKSLKVKGTITGHEDLYVDGEIEGTVELEENSLTVGPNGNVSADVKARDITVLGRLTGNVKAGERIEIRKTGSLEGDLTTSRIVIEDGAVFRGSIDIVKADGGSAGSRAGVKPQTVAKPNGGGSE
ncbi:MAG: polymer-forming cytoskeletal protein [Acidobacteria bacterium]|nr:polymer-forming cytoskeletal protein [Acidobacteriota bacterium]